MVKRMLYLLGPVWNVVLFFFISFKEHLTVLIDGYWWTFSNIFQHVLEHGRPEERSSIIQKLSGQVVNLSQQKYASNVVEKCLSFGTPDEREGLIREIVSSGQTFQVCPTCNFLELLTESIFSIKWFHNPMFSTRTSMLYLLCLVSFCMSSKCTRAFRIYCSYRTHGSMALGFNIMFTVFVLVLYDNVLMHNDFSVIVITHFDQSMQGLMKDQFGNYVVQRILQTCDDKFLVVILSSIKMHLNELKNYTFGKHIVARVEKLIITGGERISLFIVTCNRDRNLSNF